MTNTILVTTKETLVDEALQRISEIDFSGVRLKLADPIEGKGWPSELLDLVQREYERFLALTYAYPERTVVPSLMVDAFWHQHILDTRAYALESEMVFGRFLHHFPYLGMRGEEDKRRLLESRSVTERLYAMHFGPSLLEGAIGPASCGGSSCSSCSKDTDYQ